MSYKGKITTTGTSEAIRLEKDLFKQHPEFKRQAAVRADIIGPGKMLISLAQDPVAEEEGDPLISAFLSHLEADIEKNPAAITAIDAKAVARAKSLTAKVKATDKDLE